MKTTHGELSYDGIDDLLEHTYGKVEETFDQLEPVDDTPTTVWLNKSSYIVFCKIKGGCDDLTIAEWDKKWEDFVAGAVDGDLS